MYQLTLTVLLYIYFVLASLCLPNIFKNDDISTIHYFFIWNFYISCEWYAIQNQIPFDIFGNFASAHKTESKYFRLYDWPLSKHKRYCLPNQIRSHAWHQNISTFSIGHNVGCWNPTVIMTNCRVHTQLIDERI